MTDPDPAEPSGLPSDIGGYAILEPLTPGESFLAVAPGGRRVVLKRLDPDGLLRGGAKLHPSIRDRLARVRELAHARVANLHGVERDAAFDGGFVYLVWDHVAGQTIEEWATGPHASPRDVLLAARELILTLESLHARGIVHGAIHGRNVIVDPEGRLKLTHVSPLLWTDPQADLVAAAELFRELSRRRGEEESPLDRLADEADEPDGSLRSMGARAASLIDLRRDEEQDDAERRADRRRRRRSRLAAAAVVIAALFLSYGLKRAVAQLGDKPPPPPEAPAELVHP